MPTVLVVTGPSGAGKGTLIRELVERVPGIEVTVSATTRERRRGEEDGREYWFLSDDEFLARVERGEFLEHVEFVSGHRYGTLRSELDRIAANGHVPLLELETEGRSASSVRCRARSRSSSPPGWTSSSDACASGRRRAPGRSASGSSSPGSSSSRPASSTT